MKNRKRKKRPKLVLGKEYMRINGELVEIDPTDPATGIPDRCKLVLAELITGHKYKLVDPKDSKQEDSKTLIIGHEEFSQWLSRLKIIK